MGMVGSYGGGGVLNINGGNLLSYSRKHHLTAKAASLNPQIIILRERVRSQLVMNVYIEI